jgi:hypothetical protein
MSLYEGGHFFNEEVEQFMISQFIRFNVALPRPDLLIWCWEMAFYYIDQYDPYLFFWGMSDVIKTEDNYYYQYALRDGDDRWYEVEADELETFAQWSGFEGRFQDIYNTPGLSEYFDGVEDFLQNHIADVASDPHGYPQEDKFYRQYGKHAYDYIHLGLWAAIVWMISPEAGWWRHKFHPIFQMCYDYGECIIHTWTFYEPTEYRKLNRPAHSCVQCGIQEYCVELSQVDRPGVNGTYFMCENCLHPKPFGENFCGSRECEKFSCPNHPNKNQSSLVASDRRYGKLKKTKGMPHRALPGMMVLNYVAIEKNAGSIADLVDREFQRLLS